jgi:hypothetical protein
MCAPKSRATRGLATAAALALLIGLLAVAAQAASDVPSREPKTLGWCSDRGRILGPRVSIDTNSNDNKCVRLVKLWLDQTMLMPAADRRRLPNAAGRRPSKWIPQDARSGIWDASTSMTMRAYQGWSRLAITGTASPGMLRYMQNMCILAWYATGFQLRSDACF